MTTPEAIANGGIFNISAPPPVREVPVIVVPVPDEKRTPVSPEPGKPPTRRSLIQRLVGNVAVRLVFAGLAIAGTGYGISRITSANNAEPIPAEETISRENIIQLTKLSFTPVTDEEIRGLWENTKTVDLENYTFTIGFPIDQATIDKSPNLKVTQESGTILLPPIEKSKLEQKGVKPLNTLSGLSNGNEYKLIYDNVNFDASVIALGTAGVTQGEGSNSFTPAYTAYRVLFRDKQTGKISQGGVVGLYAQPLIATKPYPKDYHPGYEDGTPIKSGDLIMRLTTDFQEWDGKTGQILPGQKGQFQFNFSSEEQSPYDSRVMLGIPLTTQFVLASDGNIASHE